MRQIIAALQVSLDGFIEGPNEELDWVDSWEDTFDIIGNVDALILGARMYPGPLLRQADVAPLPQWVDPAHVSFAGGGP